MVRREGGGVCCLCVGGLRRRGPGVRRRSEGEAGSYRERGSFAILEPLISSGRFFWRVAFHSLHGNEEVLHRRQILVCSANNE